MYLETIESPSDVKKLTISELEVLCEELRHVLLTKLSRHGGHIGPNLGLVEVITALHVIFDSPKDKIVYDVSHQSYIHKMLTGRKYAFLNEDHYDDVSGYTNPSESDHDFFEIGHTSTSISLASGLAKARDLKQEQHNVIALIGDGSLSGGEAYEGLNYVAEAGTNMIVIVNDNEMSIAENHGGLYGNLKELRESNGTCDNNFFKAMGLDYRYVDDGHDMKKLLNVFHEVKGIKHPVVVHIHTIKGKGYAPAEQDKETWHWNMPFDLKTGTTLMQSVEKDIHEWSAQFLLEEMKKDSRVVAITSGTPSVLGFDAEKRHQAGTQFVDVGIAEEHAVALASGIAAAGGKPVYGVYSTFIQRTYDQLIQDLCINHNPALLLVYAASIYGMNDVTHLGIYDIAMMSNIADLVYLAPASLEEYHDMLQWGIHQQKYPLAIRVPAMGIVHDETYQSTDYSELNHYQITRHGHKVAILALGNFYTLGRDLADLMKDKHNLDVTLINPRFISGLDKELLASLKEDHELVITLEDGILDGGFGEKIARYYGDSSMLVKNYGFTKAFYDRYDADEVMKQHGITLPQMEHDILKYVTI